jgi:drug/metabolite transporter (DMT)-like permease
MYTTLAMIAFAANSLLCRMALKETAIDAASFTSMRLLSGAAMLWLLMRWQHQTPLRHGNWRGAFALFVYATAFSLAYRTINTGAGALLLFGSVQVTMLVAGFIAGERLRGWQIAGIVSAMTGMITLVLPKVETPALLDACLMLASGAAWGVYSLLGRGQPHPSAATADNFLRTVPFTAVLWLLAPPWITPDLRGTTYAILSGAVTSALGYMLWYRVLQHMRMMTAATLQLSVPVLAATGGIFFLDEMLTRGLLISSVLVLGGIWLVLRQQR